MLDNIVKSFRDKMFPCEKVMKNLVALHDEAAKRNAEASKNFHDTCIGGKCETKGRQDDV